MAIKTDGGGTTAHDKLSGQLPNHNQLPSHKLSKNKLPRQAFKLWLLAFVATALISSLFTTTPVSAQTSTDATLSGIALSTLPLLTLVPSFDAGITEYTTTATPINVGNPASSLNVGVSTTDSNATLVITGTTPDGTALGVRENALGDYTLSPLATGVNVVTIVVTAEDGATTQTYTFRVTRPADDNIDLTGITLSAGTLAPVFAEDTLIYTASVGASVTSIDVTPTARSSASTTAITATDPDGNALAVTEAAGVSTVTGLVAGANVITITVTAEDSTTQDYVITVTRATPPATLSGIAITYAAQGGQGILTPATFDSATADYTYQVLDDTTTITVAPTTTDSAATVSINGGAAVANTTSEAITLTDDSTTITFLVTATDGTTTMTYTITVIKTPVFIFETDSIFLDATDTDSGNGKIVAYEPVLTNHDRIMTNTEIDGTVRSSYDIPYLDIAYSFRLADSLLVPSSLTIYRTKTTTIGVGWSSIQTHLQLDPSQTFIARSCTEAYVLTETSFSPSHRGVSEPILTQPLPYVRQITLTEDTDANTDTDITDPLNTAGTTADYNVCIPPEALQDSSYINPQIGNLPVVVVEAYTPPTGWVVKDPDTVTLITPSATSTFTDAVSVARTDGGTALASAEVVLSFDPAVTQTGNGFNSVSVATTGLGGGQELECLTSQREVSGLLEITSLTRAEAEALLCATMTTTPTTTTTTFSPSAQPPTLGSLVPGTTNLAVSCGFRLLGQCQNLPDFHSPAIEVNTDVDLFDFSIKAMSPDRPLKEFYLGFGLPRVGSPIQSAKASVTIELAQNPDSIVGYDITDVIYQGIENPNAYIWLSLEPCSRFSNAICIAASIGDLKLYEGFEVEPMAIQVTDTSGETSRYYLAG